MTLTEKICSYIFNTQIENIPERIIGLAVKTFIDTIGIIICGSSEVQGKVISKALQIKTASEDGQQGYCILGTHHKVGNMFDAVFLNTVAAYLNEYNDLFYGMPGHPSAVLVPVVLAVGEEQDNFIREILEAYLVGIEVTAIINRVLIPKHHVKGFHSTSVAGIIGASMAAGKLLKQNEKTLSNTLGIACSLASGLRRNLGTHANFIHVGNAAANGAKAAYLAQSGLESERNLLSGEDGFLAAFYGNIERADEIIDGLGHVWAYDTPGVVIKKYPACFSTYDAIDATVSIVNEEQIDPDDIEKIDCLTSKVHYCSLSTVKPNSVYSQHFCVQYCIAVALLEKKVNIDSFKEEKQNQPNIRRLMERIHYGIHPELLDQDGFGFTSIQIIMNNGDVYEKRSSISLVERVENWMPEKLDNKFKMCTQSIIGEHQSESALAFLKRIREMDTLKVSYMLKNFSID